MKKIRYILFITVLLVFSQSVNAGSASISAPSTSVYVGSNVKIIVKTNNLWGTYSVTSSDVSVLAGEYIDDISVNSFTQDFYFTAKDVGTATITFGPNAKDNLADPDTKELFNEYRSITINVIKKEAKPSIDVNKTYSKNNYLENLSVEGYELTPNFDKETLEYEIELEPGTELVKISAKAEDKGANIKGIGEISVSEGVNTAEIVVTAENGNERTYTIKMSVEEKDPIDIKIDEKKYRVVKKRELINKPDNYEEIDVKINNVDVPGLYNDVTKVTLVGLKDEDGNIGLYLYDSKTGEFGVYNEFKFDLMNLYITEDKKSKYSKITLKVNDIEVPAYKVDGIDDYCLIYATNTSTGYKGYYLYDKKENSVQRYDTTLLDKITQEKDKYLNIVIVLSCVCFLSMLFLLIEVNRDNKREA